MLGKTSVSMMVLLVASSLIGISSIHQYIEGQTPPPAATPKQEELPTKFVDIRGRIIVFNMVSGGPCIAWTTVTGPEGAKLGLPGGSIIGLSGADQNVCTSFGLAKVGNTDIKFDAIKLREIGGRSVFSVNRVQLTLD
jgi:hypothetical protein